MEVCACVCVGGGKEWRCQETQATSSLANEAADGGTEYLVTDKPDIYSCDQVPEKLEHIV